ncbi:MAG: hypothetical protein HY811_10470 [Planctomycetes bacterium]|nr:hypothetical protein [Planctomycetota bacterium]
MRNALFSALSTVIFFSMACAGNPSQPPESKPQFSETVKNQITPEKGRAELKIPEELLRRACQNVGYGDNILGFTGEQIESHPGKAYRLESVPKLFGDITKLPRFSGRISESLLENPEDFTAAAVCGFSLLSVLSGVGVHAPGEDWGVDWIPEKAVIDEAFEAVLEKVRKSGIESPMSEGNLKNWQKLPDAIKKLAVRLIIASIEAAPVLKEAFDDEFLLKSIKADKLDGLTPSLLYKFCADPWVGENEVTPRRSFEAMERIDMKYLCFGSLCYLTYAHGAIEEFRKWKKDNKPEMKDFKGCIFQTTAGMVCIAGEGADELSGDYSLIIDLGGNDVYKGSTAIPRSLVMPISAVVDLGGNDTYDSGEEPAALACGNHGIGAIFEFEGDDSYACQSSGIGCAWYGTGLVIDYAGNDSYNTKDVWGEGAAHIGVGMLIDIAGDDNYNCVKESQGFGGPFGAGLLLDVRGNDTYKSKGELAPSVWGENPVSMAMGVGVGRRADFGDGHNLAGGVGILVEGAGDDNYQSYVFSLGCGYWWGLGMFEDCGGNDTYGATYYSFGAAAHFAAGSMVDRCGDDNYNLNCERVKASFGEGRDGSVGVFFEGEGNDRYHGLEYRCAGNSDLKSIGLFWERCGNDIYEVLNEFSNVSETPIIFGSACTDSGDNFKETQRDTFPHVGIFLDTGGSDTYSNLKKGPLHEAVDNHQWQHNKGPVFWGFGLDIDWYLTPSGDKK